MVAHGIWATTVAADPDVAFVIHGDAMIRIGPIVTRAGAAPVPDEVALFVELKNGRSRNTALRSRRFRGGVNFHGFVGIRSMDDPDMVLGVHGYTDGHAEDPMVGKRLRPKGVHFKLRRLDTGSSDGGSFLEDGGNDPESGEKREKNPDQMKFVLHCSSTSQALRCGLAVIAYPPALSEFAFAHHEEIPFGSANGVDFTPLAIP